MPSQMKDLSKHTSFSRSSCRHSVGDHVPSYYRGRFLPATAKQDLNRYFHSGVFAASPGGIERYVCNITLTRRPSQKESKFATKADKNIQKQAAISHSAETPPKLLYNVRNITSNTSEPEETLREAHRANDKVR